MGNKYSSFIFLSSFSFLFFFFIFYFWTSFPPCFGLLSNTPQNTTHRPSTLSLSLVLRFWEEKKRENPSSSSSSFNIFDFSKFKGKRYHHHLLLFLLLFALLDLILCSYEGVGWSRREVAAVCSFEIQEYGKIKCCSYNV